MSIIFKVLLENFNKVPSLLHSFINYFKLGILLGLLLGLYGCSGNAPVEIYGQVDYIGSANFFISKQPVHYKYAPQKRFPINVGQEGSFSLTIPVDSLQIVYLHLNDQRYPLIAQPGNSLSLNIQHTSFPQKVQVKGYSEPWDSLLRKYYAVEQPIMQKVSDHLPSFRNGEKTAIPELYKKRYRLAEKHFKGTPLESLYYKAVGEYLVKQLEELTYRRTEPGVDPEAVRQGILSQAKQLDFFSFPSLHAQRAGIRDFTNAYANTFGVADSLEEALGQELMQYDVKRLGYERFDSARTSVLPLIEGRRAKAYARMHLVAERIGEMSLEVARPSYEQYLQEYKEFPEYTSFLRSFYDQIARVSPGQPAIPFTLPAADGQQVSLEDFQGKYVLLDFWASWCIPCLDEFPHMKELYQRYPRDRFAIAAISIEEDSLRWRHAINRFDNPWPQLYGGKGFQQKTFKAYRGGGIPFYILVGPEGKILRYNDVRPSFNLQQVLDSLISS